MALTNAERQAAYKKRLMQRVHDAEAPFKEKLERLEHREWAFNEFMVTLRAITKLKGVGYASKCKMISEVVGGWENLDDTN